MFWFGDPSFHSVTHFSNLRLRTPPKQIRSPATMNFLAVDNKFSAGTRKSRVLPVRGTIDETVMRFPCQQVLLFWVGVTQQPKKFTVTLEISQALADEFALAIFRHGIYQHETN